MKRVWSALFLGLALAACQLPQTGVTLDGVAEGDLLATREALIPLAETVLVRINHDRDVLGLPGYTPSEALHRVAGLRAEDMLLRGYVGSVGPGDASVAAQDLMGAAGYRGRMGELIYEFVGPLDSLVDTTVTAWMVSETHRTLLLDSAYAYIGVGLMGDGERWIIVLELAQQGP